MNKAVGSYVSVPFVGKARQVGHITRISRSGSVKVRAWNATQGFWMPNERTFTVDQINAMPAAVKPTNAPQPPAAK